MFSNNKDDFMNETVELHISNDSNSFAFRESFKTLATNLTYVSESGVDKRKVFMVTSSIPHEGKTNVTVNLASALASKGKRVILLDCDLRRGTLSSLLHLSRQDIGLSSLLIQDDPTRDLRSCIKVWRALNIDVIPCGYTTLAGGELLGNEHMRLILKTLRDSYDYVICDTAPIQSVSDSLELGKFVDGSVLVVAQNIATKSIIQNTKQQLENVNIPIVGTILNMYDAKIAGAKEHDAYSYYSDYGYGYGEEKQQQ